MKEMTFWDQYFYSRYKPIRNEWGIEDLEYYERWYGSWLNYTESVLGKKFTKLQVLELGCGIGAVSSLLQKKGCDVVGSDISPVMVRIASNINPRVSFSEYDITKPYPKKQYFDCVCAFEVLEHISDLDKAIKHIYSLLKPGGFFIGSTPYPYAKNMIDSTHVNVHVPQFWKNIFVKHGFTKVKTYPLSLFPLLWRIPPYVNPVIPFYIPLPGFISTSIVVAVKPE
jgi:SAM-dependent methyltransferase